MVLTEVLSGKCPSVRGCSADSTAVILGLQPGMMFLWVLLGPRHSFSPPFSLSHVFWQYAQTEGLTHIHKPALHSWKSAIDLASRGGGVILETPHFKRAVYIGIRARGDRVCSCRLVTIGLAVSLHTYTFVQHFLSMDDILHALLYWQGKRSSSLCCSLLANHSWICDWHASTAGAKIKLNLLPISLLA